MNGSVAKFINLVALQLVRLSFNPYKHMNNPAQDPPLLVCGAFRSGTSITANILSKAGFDAGPPTHLLQATPLNPDGYFENYLFMDFSRYLFKLTDSYGDNPPEPMLLEKIKPEDISDEDFQKFTLLEIHDDRVKNINKIRVLRQSSVHFLREYLSNCFGKRPMVKNPHFSVLEPYFKNIFPGSKRVVVFRDPACWKKSAQAVSVKADEALYDRYYHFYLGSPNMETIFFNYDNLLTDPTASINKLLNALDVKDADTEVLSKLVRGHKPVAIELTTRTYPELLKKSVN